MAHCLQKMGGGQTWIMQLWKEGKYMPRDDLHHICSFCKRNIKVTSQYDLPIFDPQTGFAICKDCIKEIYQLIIDNEEENAKSVRKKFINNFKIRFLVNYYLM